MKKIQLMKIRLLPLTFFMMCIVFSTQASAFYSEINTLSMEKAGSTGIYYSDGCRYLTQNFIVTNTGNTSLINAGLVWTYMYSGTLAFDYDNSTHSWTRGVSLDGRSLGSYSLTLYSNNPMVDEPHTSYLSLSQGNTNLQLIGAPASTSLKLDHPLTLQNTDEIPVYWLGDLAPGECETITWYAKQSLSQVDNSGWSFHMENSFVAETATNVVPLAGSAWFMIGGLSLIGMMNRKSLRIRNI